MAGWRITCATLALSGWMLPGLLSAATFVAPNEGPVAFRRDLLPIDVETMIGLSEDLVVIAQAIKPDTADDRRNVARALALALALNPANATAREAIKKMEAGAPLQKPDKRILNRSQARIWHLLSWLGMPEAGKDGTSLGACLADIISLADSNHPKAEAIRTAGEKGNWIGWVAAVEAYQDKQLTDNKVVEEKMTPPEPVDPAPAPVVAKLAATEAITATPLWVTDKATGAEVLKVVTVKMTASISPPVEGAPPVRPMTFTIDFTPDVGVITRMNRGIQGALTRQFGPLPADSKVTLNLGEETAYLPLRNREALSGPAAVLLASAISGRESAATVIGRVEADGSFVSVTDLWDRLRVLSKDGQGGRLVIPSDAADILPGILALEDPEFFLKYDVLLASNLAELLDRSAKTTASPLTEILGKFQDVRAKASGMPFGQYLANRFVRQRLIDLSNEASYFASPKMLAIQAAGERPTRVSRRVLAFELRRAIEPIAWIAGKSSAEIDVAVLDKSYEQARAGIDKLERYVDSADRDFFTRVRDMTATLRSFSRASRVGANRDNGPQQIAEAFVGMRTAYTNTLTELRNTTGEREAPETPDQ